MKKTAVLWLAALVLPAQVAPQSAPQFAPKIGNIEILGLRKSSREKVQRALSLQSGQPLPGSKSDVEERLEKVPGVVRARLEAVCCEAGDAVLFVMVEEKGARGYPYRDAPAAEAPLPEEIVTAYQQFREAVDAAVRRGSTAEDLRSGHSLMADPDARALQERFVQLAEKHLGVLRDVIRKSGDAGERAIAVALIGYAPKKRLIVDDLQYALRDPDDTVRSNALDALRALSILVARDPGVEFTIAPTWLVEMLNSLYWTDREKSLNILLNLTEGRPKRTLDLVREKAVDSVLDMSRCRSLRHAVAAYTLAGRLAGLTDTQIQQAWEGDQRESVLAVVRKK